jgi:tetratricopeptide (TPR) repeat protein
MFCLLLAGCRSNSPSLELHEQRELLNQAQRELKEGRTDQAEKSAARVLKASPNSAAARLVLAEIDVQRNRIDQAVSRLDEIKSDAGADFLQAMNRAGNLLLDDGKLLRAEERFRRVLALDSENLEAHEKLANILTLEGRRWESIPHLFSLVRHDAFRLQHLLLLGDQQSVIDFSAELERSLRQAPDDPMSRIGLALVAQKNNDPQRALQLIREAVRLAPAQMEAQATLGRLLLEAPADEFIQWRTSLPPEANGFPEIWHVSGRWSELQGDVKGAMRCYWETVKRNPNHRSALYRIGQLLVRQGQSDLAKLFLERAKKLDALVVATQVILNKSTAIAEMQRAAELTESLGRPWEADAWHTVIQSDPAFAEEATRHKARIRVLMRFDLPLNLAASNPALAIDLSTYAVPKWEVRASSDKPKTLVESKPAPRFVDRAAEIGLVFTYHNGDDPQTPGLEIYQELGGGVGVLDFDRDGWPDIYLTQGSDWPPNESSAKYRDRLFRNLNAKSAQDVTDVAQLGDTRYSQGISAGDFDGDGFADLYVANVGANRLYQNQGDGTFIEVTNAAGLSSRLWTSSCMIADLNGDGMADLYDANYLAGDRPFQEVCIANQIRRACAPDRFSGEEDELLLNLGDGRFANVTQPSGMVGENGKGLGLLAADFDNRGQLNLFVANDGTPNFYFANEGHRGESPRFIERAMTSGLAFDGDGRSEACMGIALDDINRDGLWDLFVTNFHKESNTFYRQQSSEFFQDETRRAGLEVPSLPFTGFGTQFIDAELDGRPDLAVLNGHIEDFQYQGIPFRMRAQFYHNVDESHFVDLTHEKVGEYFAREQLGRALARIDWNRDGRPDLVATHLDTPVALLQNESEPAGHFLKVRLSGVTTERDAIGTTVRVQLRDGRTYMKQLTAGDGYQASNERVLTFGLGEAAQIDKLEVRWPSGWEQSWRDFPVDNEVLIVEGRACVPLP